VKTILCLQFTFKKIHTVIRYLVVARKDGNLTESLRSNVMNC